MLKSPFLLSVRDEASQCPAALSERAIIANHGNNRLQMDGHGHTHDGWLLTSLYSFKLSTGSVLGGYRVLGGHRY